VGVFVCSCFVLAGVRWWRLVLGVGGGDVRGGDGSFLVVAWCVRARVFGLW
jgi:hypothetical protein